MRRRESRDASQQRRIESSRYLLLATIAILLVGTAFAHPVSAESFNRQFEVNSQTYLGDAQLTVSYNASAEVVVGGNLIVTAMVSVDNLTGAEQYLRDYVLVATLLSDDHSVNSSVGSPTPTQRYLYPGARWGPLNFSIPLTQADTGLSPGQTVNASLTLSLITDVSYFSYYAANNQGSGYAPVFGDGGTFVLIRDPATLQTTAQGGPGIHARPLSFLLFGGGALVLAVTFAAFRKPRQGKTRGVGRSDAKPRDRDSIPSIGRR